MADKRLVEIFIELAKIEGMSGAEKDVAAWIKEFLRGLRLSAQEDGAAAQTGGNCGNVICRSGTGGDFALISHMDTARPTKELKPAVTRDRITSDGTTQLGADNRAGIAAILFAAERAVKNKIPCADFTLIFTTHEETTMGGSRGLRLDPRVKHGFIFDSSMLPGKFVIASPGAAVFNADIKGKPSHAGIAPEKGISAILIAAKALLNLPLGRINENTTANAGTMHGGGATNVIPASAQVEGEIRSFDLKEVEKLVDIFGETFKSSAAQYGGSVNFSWRWDFPPFKLPAGCEASERAGRAISRAGLNPEAVSSHGGSDANFLNSAGVQSVNFGIGAQNPHADDEFIMLDHLQAASDIALELIKK